MSTATANGRPQRKQLSDQLDRLDAILDVLAEGLPGAVGDAVRDGTRNVLKDVIAEALSDPSTVALLRRAVAPSPPPEPVVSTPAPEVEAVLTPVEPRPSFWARCKAALRRVAGGVRRGLAALVSPLTEGVQALRLVCPDVELGRPVRRAIIVALIVGGGAAVLALNSHPVATALSAVGIALTTLALQTALGAHRLVRGLLGRT